MLALQILIGGESRESLSVSYEGEPLIIGLNALFLLEILKRIDLEEIIVELESTTSACIIKKKEPNESEEYIYLIMPLRLND